jgi:IS30 family transposase
MRLYKEISFIERCKIKELREKGYSINKIAKALNRHHSSIGYEFKNNLYIYNIDNKQIEIYEPTVAQNRREFMKTYQRKSLKITIGNQIYNDLIIALNDKWSPELFANASKYNIFTECIYQFIYKHKQLRLYKKLIRHHKYRSFRTPKDAKNTIPYYKSITKRPKDISKRQAGIGHIEFDSVESAKGISDAVHTGIDMFTRNFSAKKISALNSDSAYNAEVEILEKYGDIKSATYDNGKENYLHYKIMQKFNCQSYFCHPKAPYEKGAIERANGLFGLWFPKGTDFSKVSQKEIDIVVDKINNRPMKCLNFKTPQEVLIKQLE